MSAQTDITVFDGAATPVSHTLKPNGSKVVGDEEVAVWREILSTTPYEAQVRLTTRKRLLPSGIMRCQLRVEVPVQEAPSGGTPEGYVAPPKVAYIDTFDLVQYSSLRSTSSSRRIARMMAVNLGNNVATSVAYNGAGFGPELFDLFTTGS